MGVNSLRKTVTRQRRCCDLNPGPSAPESSTLTTRLPSHPTTIGLHKAGCLQAEQTSAIHKRKFLNKFSVIHNALCRVFVAIAKTEVESCCTDV